MWINFEQLLDVQRISSGYFQTTFGNVLLSDSALLQVPTRTHEAPLGI